ncbi:hypothetical protein Tco_1515194 [Tanacetum coccineum]
MLVNLLLDHQEKISLPWFQLKKTLLLINPKTKKMLMCRIVPMQDGLQRSQDLEGAGLEKLQQQYKNDVELEYHVDQLKAAVLTETEWNVGEGDVSKPRSFKRHMSKSIKPHLSFYNNDFYYLTDGVKRYIVIILKPRMEFIIRKMQDKTSSRNEDIIPHIMSGAEKRVVYLNQHNRKSLMKLNEVKKFCDGTLTKIRENLIDMVNKNELGRGNKRLKGRDCNDKDIKRSIEMLDKIDQVMKRMEQL